MKDKIIRLDSHIHLGVCHNSLKSRNKDELVSTVLDVKQYIEREELSHAVIFYSDKNEMDELREELPNVKLYSVRWVTNLSQFPDKDDIGIKLHSSRGKSSKDEYGIDYTSIKLFNYLQKLEKGTKVFLHTQGSTSVTNKARPWAIANLAIKNPDLKFIICHSGSYGLHSYYPETFHKNHTFTAMSHELLVRESIYAAKNIPNIKLDCSILISVSHYKSKLLVEYGDFLTASDFPFCKDSPLVSIKKQEKIIVSVDPLFDITQLHEKNISFLEGIE